MEIPFIDLKKQYLSIKEELDVCIQDVISRTEFIGGTNVSNFEKNFEKKYQVDNCISCANGTDALYIAMKMLNIGINDEVITVANSWISTSETITQTGAKPVFVDCDSKYYTIDHKLIEQKITNKTKAIIPVHLYGQMSDMHKIVDIANKNNLYIIEDCAQSHFSKFNGISAGLYGDVGTFSFYPGKNLGAYGDAGAIITNDRILSRKLRLYSKHGALKKHEHEIEGINSRLDGIQAAILNVKLKYIEQWTEQRILNAKYYLEKLSDIKELILPKIRTNSIHTFHLFVVQAENRDNLKKYLHKRGIQTSIHYPKPLPFLQAYSRYKYALNEFPVSLSLSKKILSLPLYPELHFEQIDYIVDCIKDFYVNKKG